MLLSLRLRCSIGALGKVINTLVEWIGVLDGAWHINGLE